MDGPFSFDVRTDIGKVRMLIVDIEYDDFTFSDPEIQAFIDMMPASLFSAAALACETWARAQSRIAGSRRESDGTSVVRRSITELLALAKTLRESSLNGGLVTDTFDVASPNEMLDSYRPEWQNINDLPAVE